MFVRLNPEELETLDDIARIANLPPVRAEQIRFAIRQLRWTYGSEMGSLIDTIRKVESVLDTLAAELKNKG